MTNYSLICSSIIPRLSDTIIFEYYSIHSSLFGSDSLINFNSSRTINRSQLTTTFWNDWFFFASSLMKYGLNQLESIKPELAFRFRFFFALGLIYWFPTLKNFKNSQMNGSVVNKQLISDYRWVNKTARLDRLIIHCIRLERFHRCLMN